MGEKLGVVEVFATVQGEGYHAGTPAVFVRLAGCNLWSGHDKDRARDAARNDAWCPLWCDTDFRPRALQAKQSSGIGNLTVLRPNGVLSIEELASWVRAEADEAGMSRVPLIVFTGGEPTLQLTERNLYDLRSVLIARRAREYGHTRFAIETNGTRAVPAEIDWVCVSPKVPPDRLKVTRIDELKVVMTYTDGQHDLDVWESARQARTVRASHYYIQPQAIPEAGAVGVSALDADHMLRAAQWCIRHPHWKVSLQTHKILGVP